MIVEGRFPDTVIAMMVDEGMMPETVIAMMVEGRFPDTMTGMVDEGMIGMHVDSGMSMMIEVIM
jgi:hypothetical protein